MSITIEKENIKFGWSPQGVDPRDYSLKNSAIKSFIKEGAIPTSFSLLEKDTVVKNQGNYGSCTAFAGTGITRFYDNINNAFKDLSEFFLYYWNRYIDGNNVAPTGDDGSTIRSTMKALVTYGVCPEEEFPYIDANFNVEPPTVAETDAKAYAVSKYFTISENSSKVANMKKVIYSGIPIMFGSNVANSIFNVGADGIEPYDEDYAGGHARMVLGYDDSKVITGTSVKGAFLVRNSWGSDWGMNGYSWVSYKVFQKQQTDCMGITTANIPVTPTPTPVDPTDYKTLYEQLKEKYDSMALSLKNLVASS